VAVSRPQYQHIIQSRVSEEQKFWRTETLSALESIVFLVRVQCRCKESSRSLSHLLMSFLLAQSVHTSCAKKVNHELMVVVKS